MLEPPTLLPVSLRWPKPEPRSLTYASVLARVRGVVGQRIGRSDPDAVGEPMLLGAGRGDLADLEQAVVPARGRVLRFGHRPAFDQVDVAALAWHLERGEHREDHLAVLQRA